MLSDVFSKSIFKVKRKRKQQLWAEVFSYIDNIVIMSNNTLIFYNKLVGLKKNLKKIGLFFNNQKTKLFINIKNKIRFNFLGFEFIMMPKQQLKLSSVLSNMKKSVKRFVFLLRLQAKKFDEIKNYLKRTIKKILYEPRNKIYKFFQKINLILLG